MNSAHALLYGQRKRGRGPQPDLDISQPLFETLFWMANDRKWERIAQAYAQMNNSTETEFWRRADNNELSQEEVNHLLHCDEINDIAGLYPPIIVKWIELDDKRVIQITHRRSEDRENHSNLLVKSARLDNRNRFIGEALMVPVLSPTSSDQVAFKLDQLHDDYPFYNLRSDLYETLREALSKVGSEAAYLRQGTWRYFN